MTTRCRVYILTAALASLALLSGPVSSQDYTTYPTVMNPAKYGPEWAAFYARANELTRQARARFPHHLDIAFGNDPKQRLDLYLPPPGAVFRGGNSPVLLFLHGGGFKEGDRAHYGFVATPYAGHGIITVVSGYRLAVGGVHYPAQPDDVKAAILWIHHNIARYGGDPGNIFLSGHSVGATLSGEVGFDRSWLKQAGISPGAIRGIAAVSGDYDLSPGENPDYAPTAELEARASPLRHINDPAPMIVVACGTREGNMKASAVSLNEKLIAKGSKTELIVLEGADHKDTVLALGTEGSALSSAVLRMIEHPAAAPGR